VALVFLVGCGGGGGGGGGGGLLTLSGDVSVPSGTRQAVGGVALSDADVKAYIWPDFANPVAQGKTDSNGHYVLTLPETAVGKDIVVVATKVVGGKTVRVEKISSDLPREGRSNVNLDAFTTFACEEIARIREQEGLNDLSPGGVATVEERIRERLGEWNGHLGDVLPAQIGGGLGDQDLQNQVQNTVQQYKDSLKGSTGNPDVDTARKMMQTIRDMAGTVVGNGRDEGTAIDTALNLTVSALDQQLSGAEEFATRFDIMMSMLDRLDGQPPGEYRLVGTSQNPSLERVGDIAGGKTWKVTSQVDGASNGMVLTVTVENAMDEFSFDPGAGKYTVSATKSGVNYSATMTPTVNEGNKTVQLNASINLQDAALSQAITFNGTLTATFAQLPSGDAPPQITSVTFNGSLKSQFGSAQVTGLKVEFDPDSSQQDSLKRVSLSSLEAQIAARPLTLTLQGVDIPFMKLNGGGTAPTQVTINSLQVTGRDKNDKQIRLTISPVKGTFEEYRDPYNGMGSGVIKTLSGKLEFASDRFSLNGEVNGTWNNSVPFSEIPTVKNQLSTFPDGTISIKGNMTPAIGKRAGVDITIESKPHDATPRITVTATFTYGDESMSINGQVKLVEDAVDGVVPSTSTINMTHSPSGMKMQISAEREQPATGSINKSDGTKIADVGEAQALGISELGHTGIVKYVDGTFETLESLLP
ncbi:MAG: hypothetical protein ACUVRT_00880, partial [Armatimonadota bacterium]